MTLAGESAPLSGLEHVTSHTLDMAAGHHHRPTGNHGSQCALATILSLIAWQRLLSLDELTGLDDVVIDAGSRRQQVQSAFGPLDDDGDAWRECWHDVEAKIDAWTSHAAQIRAFAQHWPQMRQDLRGYLASPRDFVAALAATGHPLTWTGIPTGITAEQARWAFGNAHLMRKRTSVADVLAFAGLWTDDLIDDIFAEYLELIRLYTHAQN